MSALLSNINTQQGLSGAVDVTDCVGFITAQVFDVHHTVAQDSRAALALASACWSGLFALQGS